MPRIIFPPKIEQGPVCLNEHYKKVGPLEFISYWDDNEFWQHYKITFFAYDKWIRWHNCIPGCESVGGTRELTIFNFGIRWWWTKLYKESSHAQE